MDVESGFMDSSRTSYKGGYQSKQEQDGAIQGGALDIMWNVEGRPTTSGRSVCLGHLIQIQSLQRMRSLTRFDSVAGRAHGTRSSAVEGRNRFKAVAT
jgi:hypothetical protein